MTALVACAGFCWAPRAPAEGAGDPPPYRVDAPSTPRRPPAKAGSAKHVLVISVDGLSFDMFRRLRFRMPHLRRLARSGFWRPVESVFPSMTWSAHVSLVTGQYPRHHGVLGNRWLEGRALIRPYRDGDADARRRARAPSLLDLAAAEGWTVGALNWPATQGATDVLYNMPETMYHQRRAFDWLSPALRRLIERHRRREFVREPARPGDHLAALVGRVTATEGVETDLLVRDVARWIVAAPQPRWLRGDPPRCTAHSGRCLKPSRGPPRLLLVHLLTPDTWMHRYGTNPWVVRWGLEQADAAIGAILAAYRRARILSDTAVFVVSDHGFVEIESTLNLPAALAAARIKGYRTLLNGHAAFLYSSGPGATDVDTVVRALRAEGCVEAVYAPAAYEALGLPSPPEDGADPSAPDEHPGAPALVALSRPRCIFRSRGPLRGKLGSQRIGFHGYLPTHPELRAVLLGGGAGIRRSGRRPRARIVDVAPTVAHLLGLRWPDRWPGFADRAFVLDGRPLGDILRPRRGSTPRGANKRR